MRHFRTTLVLAAVLLGLAVYTFYVERPREERRVQSEEQAKHLLAIDVADATGLTIETRQSIVTLEKDAGGSWLVSRPIRTRADQQAVATVLDRLKEAKITRVVEERAVDLKAFGLDHPDVLLTLRLKGGREERLALGGGGPVDSTLFVKKPAETKVLLADLSLKAALNKTFHDLRDKTVVRFVAEQVTFLRLEYRDRQFALKREADTWHLAAPIQAQADRGTVESLLATLRGLTADEFVDERKDRRRAKLSAPTLTVRVGLPGGDQTVVFYAAKGTHKVYAVTPDPDNPLYLITEDAVSRLEYTLFALRDKTVLMFSRTDVKEMTIRTPAGQWTLTAKDAGWVVDGKTRAKTSSVTRLLDRLETLRVERFLDDGVRDLAAKGLAPPKLEIELTGPAQARQALLSLGREEKGLVYAKVTDAKGGLRFVMLARDLLDAIPHRQDIIEETGGT